MHARQTNARQTQKLAKVDCTTEPNKALAEKFGIKGFPTIKVGHLMH
jgi:thioredoxin-like negative regulator of GroEL